MSTHARQRSSGILRTGRAAPDHRGATPSLLRRAAAALLVALVSAATVVSGAGPAAAEAPQFGFYLAPPFVQTPYYSATIQNFGALPTGTATSPQTWTGISTTNGVTGTWRVEEGGDYGGATSVAPASPGAAQPGEVEATRSQYASIASGEALDIRLSAPATCLGLWWSAGDANNSVTVYTDAGTTLVATLTTATLTALLGTSDEPEEVTAINGTTYNAGGDYFGHPVTAGTPRSASNEPFAYLHAISSGGVTFDRIVLEQGGGGGFEFDNIAIAADCARSTTLVVIDEDLLDPTFEAEFIAANTPAARPAPPTLTCTPDPVAPGARVTCEVSRGPAHGEILWNAALDAPFAGQGVTLDGQGRGTFTFTAPREAVGRSIAISLVAWDATDSVTVTGLPVPTSIPAGEGTIAGTPIGTTLLLGVLMALVVAMVVALGGARSSRAR
jgi:hypothetical protein